MYNWIGDVYSGLKKAPYSDYKFEQDGKFLKMTIDATNSPVNLQGFWKE